VMFNRNTRTSYFTRTVDFSALRDNMKLEKTCEEDRWGKVELRDRRQYRKAQNKCLYGPLLTTFFSGALK
jgi:hypothetical protein